MQKNSINWLLFSNIYVSVGAVLSAFATCICLALPIDILQKTWWFFVFFATMCSYCLHWALTERGNEKGDISRLIWTEKHRKTLFLLSLLSLFFVVAIAWQLLAFWSYIVPLALLTFLYTAPKIPFRPFVYLRGYAVAKTLYLSSIWTIVSCVMPIFLAKKNIQNIDYQYFIANRFLLIFSICMLFDYRDRTIDDGIKNCINYLNERYFSLFFNFIVALFCLLSYPLSLFLPVKFFVILLLPMLLLVFIFEKSIRFTNDYWYYGVLDGLIFLSGFLLLLDCII